MSAPKAHDDKATRERPTEADPHGRDHDGGLAGAENRDEVDRDERFANSREDGVVDKHNYLDDVGEAVASTLGSVIGQGGAVDDEIDDEMHGRDDSSKKDAPDAARRSDK